MKKQRRLKKKKERKSQCRAWVLHRLIKYLTEWNYDGQPPTSQEVKPCGQQQKSKHYYF